MTSTSKLLRRVAEAAEEATTELHTEDGDVVIQYVDATDFIAALMRIARDTEVS